MFTLTVFPDIGEPYQTTIQFITIGELPNFYTGRFVAFIEDKNDPGYGVIEINPNETWRDKVNEPSEKFKMPKPKRCIPTKAWVFDQNLRHNFRYAIGIRHCSFAHLSQSWHSAALCFLSGNFDKLVSGFHDLPKNHWHSHSEITYCVSS